MKLRVLFLIPFITISILIKKENKKEYNFYYEKYAEKLNIWYDKFPTVCTTWGGYAYHRCYHYKASNSPTNLYLAEKGRSPCQVCKPPRIEKYLALVKDKPIFKKPNKPFFVFNYYIPISIVFLIFGKSFIRTKKVSKEEKSHDKRIENLGNRVNKFQDHELAKYWSNVVLANCYIEKRKTNLSWQEKNIMTKEQGNLNVLVFALKYSDFTNYKYNNRDKISTLNLSNLKPDDWSGLSRVLSLMKIKEVQKLDLSNNNINNLSIIKHFNLKYTELDLSYNEIVEIKKDEIYRSIKKLNISFNLLTTLKNIIHLKDLEDLKLNGNLNLKLEFISELKQINNLFIGDGNDLTHIEEINHLPHLIAPFIINPKENQNFNKLNKRIVICKEEY